MVVFLRNARAEWTQLAEGWEAIDNADEARRARNQQGIASVKSQGCWQTCPIKGRSECAHPESCPLGSLAH